MPWTSTSMGASLRIIHTGHGPTMCCVWNWCMWWMHWIIIMLREKKWPQNPVLRHTSQRQIHLYKICIWGSMLARNGSWTIAVAIDSCECTPLTTQTRLTSSYTCSTALSLASTQWLLLTDITLSVTMSMFKYICGYNCSINVFATNYYYTMA